MAISGKITWEIRAFDSVGVGKFATGGGNGNILATGDRTCQADLKIKTDVSIGLRRGHFKQTIDYTYNDDNIDCPFDDGNVIYIKEITLLFFSIGQVKYSLKAYNGTKWLLSWSFGAAFTDNPIALTNTRH